jgi:hypothetical protein
MQESSDSRIAPFAVCGITSACLAFVGIAARNMHATTALSAVAASLLALAACGGVAWFARERIRAWRLLWLVVALLAALAAWQVFVAFLGSPIKDNDPAARFFILWGSFLFGLAGTLFFGFLACAALLLAWLMGRPRPKVTASPPSSRGVSQRRS